MSDKLLRPGEREELSSRIQRYRQLLWMILDRQARLAIEETIRELETRLDRH
jgi:hypothetical protein